MRGLGDCFAIFLEPREVAINQAHQSQIDQHQFHRSVADAFAERIRRGVNLVRAGSDGPEGIGDRQSAVVVAVPVHANFFAARASRLRRSTNLTRL